VIVSLIAAVDENGGIGKAGKLPWHLGADLQRFKELTLGHHIIMGRKTFQSIAKQLSGRTNIVISRNTLFAPQDCLVVHSLEDALSLAEQRGENEAFVIGGGEIFAQALPLADRIYLTRVQASLDCDVFFPSLNEAEWIELDRFSHPADEKNDYPFIYRLLARSPLNE
jgi:dihydrofolate reductase